MQQSKPQPFDKERSATILASRKSFVKGAGLRTLQCLHSPSLFMGEKESSVPEVLLKEFGQAPQAQMGAPGFLDQTLSIVATGYPDVDVTSDQIHLSIRPEFILYNKVAWEYYQRIATKLTQLEQESVEDMLDSACDGMMRT